MLVVHLRTILTILTILTMVSCATDFTAPLDRVSTSGRQVQTADLWWF